MRARFTPRAHKSPRSRRQRIAPLAGAVLALAAVVPPASAADRDAALLLEADEQHVRHPAGQATRAEQRAGRRGHHRQHRRRLLGNDKHHAKRSTASDHLRCTITGSTGDSATATCDAQIAIGGSMLLANHAKLTFSESSAPVVVSINGGTGLYRHAHGTVTSTSVGNNSDLTIKVTY